jgi:hypothetical protein
MVMPYYYYYYYYYWANSGQTLFKVPKTVHANPEPWSEFRKMAVHALSTQPVLQTPFVLALPVIIFSLFQSS